MRAVAARVYFALCLALGRLLRAGRYARVRVVRQGGALRVRKVRRAYAPLLIRLVNPLYQILGTGVRVLPQRAWEERELLIYRELHGRAIGIEGGRVLTLPHLAGETLAAVLGDPTVAEAERERAIALAVAALAAFHHLGQTHGDAMAENVLIDREAGRAHWFDFETVHDPRRPLAWRRADDLRALLATCLVRTAPEHFPACLDLVLNGYPDPEVHRAVAAAFASIWRRALAFHLAQAGLSLPAYRAIARLLGARRDG